jgi:hypothetical protein
MTPVLVKTGRALTVVRTTVSGEGGRIIADAISAGRNQK